MREDYIKHQDSEIIDGILFKLYIFLFLDGVEWEALINKLKITSI